MGAWYQNFELHRTLAEVTQVELGLHNTDWFILEQYLLNSDMVILFLISNPSFKNIM